MAEGEYKCQRSGGRDQYLKGILMNNDLADADHFESYLHLRGSQRLGSPLRLNGQKSDSQKFLRPSIICVKH